MADSKKTIEFIATTPGSGSTDPVKESVDAVGKLLEAIPQLKEVLDKNAQFIKENKAFIAKMNWDFTDAEKKWLGIRKGRGGNRRPPTGGGPPQGPLPPPNGPPPPPPGGGGPPTPPPGGDVPTPKPPQGPDQFPEPKSAWVQLAKASAKGIQGLSQLADSSIGALKTLGLLAAGFLAAKFVVNQYIEAVKKAVESVGNFSAATNIAKARGDIMRIEDQIKSANEVGGDVGSFIDMQNEFHRSLRDIFRDLVGTFLPVLTFLGTIGAVAIKLLRLVTVPMWYLAEIVEVSVEKFLEILKSIPGIGWTVSGIYDWMRKDDIPQDQTIDKILDGLFGSVELDFDPAEIRRNIKQPTATPPKQSPAKPNGAPQFDHSMQPGKL